jgi:hypothetical protein
MTGVGVIDPLLWCLKATDVDIWALNDVLKQIACHGESFKTTPLRHVLMNTSESLRREIIDNHEILAEILSSHYPVQILRMTTAFTTLLSQGKAHLILRFKANNKFRRDMPESSGDGRVSKPEEGCTALPRSASPPPRTWSVVQQHVFSAC